MTKRVDRTKGPGWFSAACQAFLESGSFAPTRLAARKAAPQTDQSVAEMNTTVADLNNLVRQQQKWIDSSRARIIALEKLVDMLVVGAVTRGECTVNQVRDLKYGMEKLDE